MNFKSTLFFIFKSITSFIAVLEIFYIAIILFQNRKVNTISNIFSVLEKYVVFYFRNIYND